MTFTFDPESHIYTLDGRALLSVTSVLKEAGLLVYPQSAMEAMLRGKYVHAATEMIDRGTLDWDGLDPILLPYCRAYEKFIADAKPGILLSEKPMHNAQWMYAGTPDRIVRMNGITTLIDLKTGSPHPATGLQCAAYAEMVRVNEDMAISKAFALYLKDDGTYRLTPENELKRNFNTFLAALHVAAWKKENL